MCEMGDDEKNERKELYNCEIALGVVRDEMTEEKETGVEE